MQSLKYLTMIPVICLTVSPALAQYKIGDRLVVIREASIGMDNKPLEKLGRGQDIRVDDVNGDWLWVKHLQAGWIHKDWVRPPNEALMIFGHQIGLNPNDVGAYYAAAVTRMDRNDLDNALLDFNAAIATDPQACAYNGRGNCWLRKGQFDNAIADYTAAIQLKPADVAVMLANRGRAYVAKADYAQAITDANEAIRLEPRYASAFSVRADAYVAQKKFDSAVADCDAIRRISGRGLQGYNDVAWILATSPNAAIRDGKRAIELATKACEMTNWADGSVLDTLAVAYAEKGDFSEAVKWESKALEIISNVDRADAESRLELFKANKPFRS